MTEKKEKAKFSFKNLTKKQIIIIVVAVVAVCAAIALSIALPLTLSAAPVAEPIFADFDANADTDVVVNWKKISGAKSYTVEYCFGARTEDNIHSVTTSGNRFFTERRIGVISVRVRAEVGEKATFSEWISMDVPAYKLSAPTVAFNAGTVGWADVTYLYRKESKVVKQYSFAIKVDDNEYQVFPPQSSNSVDLKNYLVAYIDSFYEPGITDWEDVVISVKVAALTTLPAMYNAGELKNYEVFLQKACEQSEEVAAEFTIIAILRKSSLIILSYLHIFLL